MKTSQKEGPVSRKIGQASEKVGQVEKALLYFYEHPNTSVTIREFAQTLRWSKSTTHAYLQLLQKKEIISSDHKWIDSWQNHIKKTNFYIEKVVESGLIDYLELELAASAIILFGSFRKGESQKDSDIDLFVECARERALNLKKYEQLLGHNIELFTRKKITQLPQNLLNNVVNGIKLKGYFTIK